VRGALRQAALILATTALSVQLAGWAHLASQRHATCAEHGEMIEVGGDAQAVELARPSGPRIELASSEEAHGHDHCLTALQRHQRSVTSAPSGAAFGSVADLSHPTIAVDDAYVPQPLLLIAPKTSPPALA
jgi:hypothetical protein